MIIVLFGSAGAQEVSTEVITSEEELFDALISGEIDYETYIVLYDLLVNGVDTTDRFLLDQIPGVAYSLRKKTSRLAQNQMSGFVSEIRQQSARGVSTRYRFGHELEDAGRSKYRFKTRFVASSHWSADLSLAKEYSGNERVLQRSLTYTNGKSDLIRRMTLGSIRARFGLGTIVGYRGKLLDYSNRIDGESWLCPDWGGFNGVLVDGGWGTVAGTMLGSYLRDSQHTLSTAAVQITVDSSSTSPTVIAAIHTLSNSATGKQIQVYQAGIDFIHRLHAGSFEYEVSGQASERNAGAIVAQVENEWSRANASMTGWYYGDGYLGLAAGSRAASLSVTDENEAVDFKFSDRRAGQFGMILRTQGELSQNVSITSDLLWAQRGGDTTTIQTLIAVERMLGNENQVRLDYQYKSTEKAGTPNNIRQRGRCEWAMDRGNLRSRTTVGFTDETSFGRYWSLSLQLSGKGTAGDRWQILSNWRRLSHGRIDYWHGFASITEQLAKGVRGGIKFTDTYNRSSNPRHAPSVTLELLVQL